MLNIDNAEKIKFDTLGRDWWDARGKFRPLHEINSTRLAYINARAGITRKNVIDVGCGGGILAEAMTGLNARVTGIDISEESLKCARQHGLQAGLSIQYEASSPEEFAASREHHYDVVTCMELLEHVPDPLSVVAACVQLARPGGHVFFSTINRTVKAYLLGILAAEYVLKLLPAGAHDYAKFIRPSELAAWCRHSNLEVLDITGIRYIPFLHRAELTADTGVNYLLHARLPGN